MRALPGIDVDHGLSMTLGDAEALARLLLKMVNHGAGELAALRAALHWGDRKAAFARVHSMLGGASSLGAHRLAARLEALEGVLRAAPGADADADAAQRHLRRIDAELAALAATLSTLV